MPSSKTRLVGNLPASVSSFIGRRRENDVVKALISAHRLVTLSGTGGCGKTRLAYKVAEEMMGEFEDGVWAVELAPLTEAGLVLQSIAAVFGIHEKSGRTLSRLLVEHLKPRRTLLLVDNCQHLIVACAVLLEELLQACPDLKVLATSREMLGISGEIVWTVPPLSMPEVQSRKDRASAEEALQAYQQSEAVGLFLARAASANPEFRLTAENGGWIADICRRLDGMPLAIELAAARVRSLSVEQIAERLDDRFHLLTAGSRTGPPRQQTLAATFDWSYTLLLAKEQKILRRLAVFASGATLEAIESVCAGNGVEEAEVLDLLSHLVDKSLTLADQKSPVTRYSLLETIRQYARERLTESGEETEARNLHLRYFTEWAEKAEPYLEGQNQLEWLDRFEGERDIFRTALEWCRTAGGKADSELRLVAALGLFWETRGHFSEGREQLAATLARIEVSDRTEVHAKALYMAANLAFNQTDYPETRARADESLSIYRELGPAGRLGLAKSLIMLGDMWREAGSYETARSLLEEALGYMRELNDLHGVIRALWQLGYCAVSTGDIALAERYFKEALPMSKRKGDKFFAALILTGLAEAAVRQGDYKGAATFEEESLELRRKIGDKWGVGVSLGSFAWIALRQGDFTKATTLLLESLVIRREIEDRGGVAWCLEKLAKINLLLGWQKSQQERGEEFSRSTRLFGAAAALRAPVGSVIDLADKPEYDGDVEVLQNELGKETFATVWSEGESIPLETIIREALSESAKESTRSEKEKYGGLTEREREVAQLISQGKSNREIAEDMTVGVKTVETYITRILNKLGFDSRVQIATRIIEKNSKENEPRS